MEKMYESEIIIDLNELTKPKKQGGREYIKLFILTKHDIHVERKRYSITTLVLSNSIWNFQKRQDIL